MSKVAWSKAQAADRRIVKSQWGELVKILQSNYEIKTLNKTEVFLKVPGEDTADIEIFVADPPVVDPFHVQLWYFQLENNDSGIQSGTCSSVSEVIRRIDDIMKAVKVQKKYG